MSEALRMAGGFLRGHVGHDRGDGRTDTGKDTDAHPDQRRAQHRPPVHDIVPHREENALEGGAHDVAPVLRLMDDVRQDLADGKESDHHRQHVETGIEPGLIEGQTLHAGTLVDPREGHEHAEKAGDQALHHGPPAERGDQRQCHGHQREGLPGSEIDTDPRQRFGQHHEREPGHRATDDRCRIPEPERTAGLPRPRQRIPVETGHDRIWLAGDPHQRRGDETTAGAADEHRDQQHHRIRRGHREGEGKCQRHQHPGRDARQHANDDPGEHAAQQNAEAVWREERDEGVGQHHGRSTPRTCRKTSVIAPASMVPATVARRTARRPPPESRNPASARYAALQRKKSSLWTPIATV